MQERHLCAVLQQQPLHYARVTCRLVEKLAWSRQGKNTARLTTDDGGDEVQKTGIKIVKNMRGKPIQ